MAFAGFGEQDMQVNNSKESYSVIIQRNIFSKDRSARKPERVEVPKPDPNTIDAPPDIAFVYVIRGVAIDSDKKIAFFENQSSGEFFQASIGEQIDGMVIKDIKANRVVFTKNQSQVEIMVGMDLSGVVINSAGNTATSESSGSSGSSSSPAGSGGVLPGIQGSDESEILRKMLERRKQQFDN
jgi:hypothetical protein